MTTLIGTGAQRPFRHMRTLQAATVKLSVWSLIRGPHELGYATNLRITAEFSQQPQYEINGTGNPYEIIEGVMSAHMQMGWLIVPHERLHALGFVNPGDFIGNAAEILMNRLLGYDGINIIGEDKLTGKPLFRCIGAKMSNIGMTLTRRAVLVREASYVIREMPFLDSDFFNQ
jgi:hypothetical protein